MGGHVHGVLARHPPRRLLQGLHHGQWGEDRHPILREERDQSVKHVNNKASESWVMLLIVK